MSVAFTEFSHGSASGSRDGGVQAPAVAIDSLVERVKRGVFGTLHVMTENTSKSTRFSRFIELLFLLIDFHELIGVVVLPDAGWHGGLVSALESLSLQSVVTLRATFTLFLVAYAAVVLLSVACVADAAYVSYSFQTNSHRVLWPVKALVLLAKFFITAGFIPTLSVLILPFRCSFVTSLDGAPDSCLAPSVLLLMVASGLVVATFVPMCVVVALLDFERDPHSRQLKAAPLGRGEFLYTLVRAALVFVGATALQPATRAAVITCLLCAVVAYFAMFLPFYKKWINGLRCGLVTTSELGEGGGACAAVHC